jgi:hypothetical protein
LALPVAILELMPVTEADAIAKCLIYLFEYAKRGKELMNAMIDIEITRQTDEGTLFRSNNATSKGFK